MISDSRSRLHRLRTACHGMLLAWLGIMLSVGGVCAGQQRPGNPNFLIENWLEDEGLPESAALSIAETPDGYLWVGTSYGVVRYNGIEFAPSGRASGSSVLTRSVHYLFADREGRLWASGDTGLAYRDKGGWQTIRSLDNIARSMAEDPSGQIWLGTYDGGLFTVCSNQLVGATAPPGLVTGGVFCLSDLRDGGLWVANKGFIGRRTGQGWQKLGPPVTLKNALLAAPSRSGGIWTYTPGTLSKYEINGSKKDFSAPDLEWPRVLMEDNDGAVWVASTSLGCVRLMPGGPILATATASNGLVHNSVWSLLQDKEDSIWLGTSCGGLCRVKPRVFHVMSVAEGLPNQIVRTVTEEAPGQMIVGTHGRGAARILDGKVLPKPAGETNRSLDYIESVLLDHAGRTWMGTYRGGLWYRKNGVETNFAMPPSLGLTVSVLFEDSHNRIWAGTSTGLGVIENDVAKVVGGNSALAGTMIWAVAEDTNSGAIWVGTYDKGLFRLQDQKLTHFGKGHGLPSDRISSLLMDHRGNLWVGLYDKGIACVRSSQISLIGPDEGLAANIVGFMIEDGLGCIWIGTDEGLLRASEDQLQAVIQGTQKTASFSLFDASDGLYSADCSPGYQPAAVRDSNGHLWFATMNGVVTVDPSQIRLNTNPPPVALETFTYKDAKEGSHTLYTPGPGGLLLPPGSHDLNFSFAALSFRSPEKNRYAYRIAGFNENWVPLGNRHSVYLHLLPPGAYRLQIKASNNDDAWGDTGTGFSFTIQPHFWQTRSFMLAALLCVAGAGGLAARQYTSGRFKARIVALEQQKALEHERARLATVMEATSDLVAFADNEGRLLHLNPAGRRLLGLQTDESLAGLTLSGIHTGEKAEKVTSVGIPMAKNFGLWEGETAVLHRDGREIPVMETIMAHHSTQDGSGFLSAIARDITAQKLAEQASERLQSQLLQSQKMESVGRLAGGIAHDFNNMLQVILGNADLALAEAPPNSDLHSELLEIQKSANRSAELTSQLLTFARKQVFRAQELDLAATVTGTSKMLQRLIGENIQLAFECDEELWTVRMDPSQITQILTNLSINSRDAISGQGNLTIRLKNITLPHPDLPMDVEAAPGDYVTLAVKDDGSGMPPEVMKHLFEPFFTTKDVGLGTGLGLATVFGIVKQNRGFIQVESELGHGSTFRIFLPRSTPLKPMSTPSATAPRQPVHGTETILIVEDEENILQLIVLTLRKHGYQVVAATVPEMALILAASNPGKIDLLVTDIVMPGMNGKQLQEKLAPIQPQMKALFMSGYTADIIAQHGDLEAGLNFLQKPFTIQNFLEKVRKTLASGKPPTA